jgi:hypothetical protein
MHNPGKLSHKFSKSRDKSSANDLIKQFRDIYTFLRGFPTVESVLFELPPYSIYEYNKHKGREDTKYRDDDKILHEHRVAQIKQILQLETL